MACAPDRMLVLNPGSDWLDRVTPQDEAGPVDATGWTAEIRDVTGDLAGAVAAAMVAGQVELAVTWQSAWPLTGALLGSFRLALLDGGTEKTSFLVEVWVSADETRIDLARGSDLTPQFIWDDDRLGADLTGDTIEVINASAQLAPLLTAGIVDAATRRVWFHIEGDPTTPLGDLGTFQLRRSTAGVHRRTIAPIRIISR